jgi:DNA-binding NarL/FixJ family response regulator
MSTSQLLQTAAGDDPVLLRALVLIDDRSTGLTEVQLAALDTLTRAWVGPTFTEAPPVDLTERQREILMLISDGLTIQAIAHRLCLSPRTVEKHMQRLYRRLGACDRLNAVLQAQRFGLISG